MVLRLTIMLGHMNNVFSRLENLFSCLEFLQIFAPSKPDKPYKKPPAGYESQEDFDFEFECLTALRNGNPRKARRMMKEWREKKGDALKWNKFSQKILTNFRNEASARAKELNDYAEKQESGAKGLEPLLLLLKNNEIENNCFLKCIIQCLWNLRQLRYEFQRISEHHYHVGSPCVICSLYATFNSLTEANDVNDVDLTSLKSHLKQFYSGSTTSLFQMVEKNDASELLNAILNCSHLSSTYLGPIPGSCTVECSNSSCLAYSIFRMDYLESISGFESKFSNYRSFIRRTSASTLRELKVVNSNETLSELLLRDDSDIKKPCEGCDNSYNVQHRLVSTAKVFTLGLKWQKAKEDVEDIRATLAVLDTEVQMSVVYSTIAPQAERLHLNSMVCFYGRHHVCFVNNHGVWFLHDDFETHVTEVGTWNNVVAKCIQMPMQPSLLFFDSVADTH